MFARAVGADAGPSAIVSVHRAPPGGCGPRHYNSSANLSPVAHRTHRFSADASILTHKFCYRAILLLSQMFSEEALNQPGELGGASAFHGGALWTKRSKVRPT